MCASPVRPLARKAFSVTNKKKTRQEKVDDGEPGTWDLPDATHSFHHVTVLNTLRESVRSARNVCLCECVCTTGRSKNSFATAALIVNCRRSSLALRVR